ncbi:pentapeptide repeat-containing protein [Saccharothrix sp. HUAS TT1]|uniref:pentapeptide repeat-containing protein n=1 Tax=unclassified Saccharothrix TaxID=2593673 RepID=UPI00345B5B81
MPDGSLPGSVVRFTDAAGHVVGVGVLVGERRVLTCAHVVNLAVGRDGLSGAPPDDPVLVDFPGRAAIRATVRQWLPPPPREGAPGQDVAGLELAEDAPAGATPAKLITTLPGPGHEVDVFGYPDRPARPDGAWVRAVVRGRVGNGYLQLDSTSALQVQPGYSGSPVWDPVTGRVVGIIATAGRTAPDCYAITADLLRLSWPDALDHHRRRGDVRGPDRLDVLHLAGTRFGRDGDHRLTVLHHDLEHLAAREGLRPDLVVVAGDLTERGLRTEFEQAFAFLEGLAEAVELPRDRVVVVPGPHDVNLVACRAYFLDMEAEQREPVPPYWRKWKQYGEAFDRFYRDAGATFTPDEHWTFFTAPDLRVAVAGLNSTVADSHVHDGTPEVDAAQLRRFAAHLEEHRAKGWLRLGVVHRSTAGVKHALVRPGLVDHLLTGTPDAGSYELVSFDERGFTRHARRFEPDQGRWVGDTRVSPDGADWRVRHVLRPTSAHAFRTTPREEERARPPLAGDSFFERVAEATRISHPGATVTPYLEHAYLRVTKPTSGGGVEQWPVAVVEGDVTADGVERFARDVHVRFAEHDRSVRSELVHGGAPAPAELVARALSLGIRLRSWVDYQGMLDLRAQEHRQQARLADDPIYPAHLYVPQRFHELTRRGPGEVRDNALDQVLEWLSPDAARFVVVLGDFGRGKSFLLRQLARELRSRLGNVSPVLVELRSLEKAPTLDELLTQHLVREGVEVLDVVKLRYMIGSGRLALLFDGFDELELRVGYDNAAEYLRTLLVAVSDRAKVVLTSRSQHFRSHNQVLTALGDQVAAMSSSRVAVLEDFTDGQVLDFLTRHYRGDAGQAERRFDLLREVHDLLGLSRNPRMLAFIADLDERRLRQVRQEQGRISAAELYRELVDFWLLHEAERQRHPSGLRSFDELERLRVCTVLASRLWSGTAAAVQASDLGETVAQTLTELVERGYSTAQAAHAVGSGTLLVNTEDGFGFVHQSVMEWLVANAAAEQVRDGAVPSVMSRPMSPLMVDFFCDLAGHAAAREWAVRVATRPGADKVVRLNAVAVWDRLGGPATVRQHLVDLDLRHRDLSGVDLRGTAVTGADLRGQRLTDADLTGADLAGADFRGVRMTGGDLTGARLTGSDWRGAVLLGVRGVEEHPELAEATVVGRDPASVVTAVGGAQSLAYSPDGTVLAVASGWAVTLVERATRKALRTLTGHTGHVTRVAWSPTGEHLASSSDDGTARIWTRDGDLVTVVGGHQDGVRCVAFAPGGQHIVTGSRDRTARIWTLGGDEVAVLLGHEEKIEAVAFAPDRRHVTTASDDGTVRIWTVDGEPVSTLAGHTRGLCGVAFSPDGEHLVTGAHDTTARIWTIGGSPVATLQHSSPVYDVAYSPDGKHIATTTTSDHTLTLWASDGTRTAEIGRDPGTNVLAFSPDGEEIATANNRQVLFCTPTGDPLDHHGGQVRPVTTVIFSPDGASLATASTRGAHLWAGAGPALTIRRGEVAAIAFAPDGRSLAVASFTDALRVHFLDQRLPLVYSTSDTPVVSVAFSPDGRRVLGGTIGGEAHIWSVDGGSERLVLSGHALSVEAVAFSPDGKRFATASADGTAHVWTTSGRLTATYADHSGWLTSVVFSPDGRYIATASADGTARVRTRRHRTALVLRGHGAEVWAVAFAPDSKLLATCSDDGTARVWSLQGREVAVLRGHLGPVRCVAFSPDGKHLATTSTDGTTRIWSVGGTELAKLINADDGWAVLLADGSYRIGGDVGNQVWWAVRSARFEEGELDPYVPEIRRMPDHRTIPGIVAGVVT